MRLFRWLSANAIPPSIDLRQLGWQFASENTADDDDLRSPGLAQVDVLDDESWRSLRDWHFAPMRALVLLTGIDDLDVRARLLRMGFGDVTGSHISLHEIEARAQRISAHAALMPRMRHFGPLQLDLFARDAFAGERRLGLHPREFALIWRLSDTPGQAVSKRVLIRDVWRMAHVPETNSLAVHVYRLRARLAPAGMDRMVQTTQDGAYLFQPFPEMRRVPSFIFADGRYEEDPPLALSVLQGLTKDSQA